MSRTDVKCCNEVEECDNAVLEKITVDLNATDEKYNNEDQLEVQL